MIIKQYHDSDYSEINKFVISTSPERFINTPKFLSYHGDRFNDFSLVIRNKKSQVIGFFPAAVLNDEIISHPGLTFGGLITSSNKAEEIFQIYDEIINFYKSYKKLSIKLPPPIYLKNQFLEEAYFRYRNFKSSSFFLTSIVELKNSISISKGKKDNIRKAKKLNSIIVDFSAQFKTIFPGLEESLASIHNATPTHSLKDLELLNQLFPENIYSVAALSGSEVLAGAVIFESGSIIHTQYLFNSPAGRNVGALDFLILELISNKRSKEILSFGSSSEDGGEKINIGLLKFKEGFGSKIQLGKTFEIELS